MGTADMLRRSLCAPLTCPADRQLVKATSRHVHECREFSAWREECEKCGIETPVEVGRLEVHATFHVESSDLGHVNIGRYPLPP